MKNKNEEHSVDVIYNQIEKLKAANISEEIKRANEEAADKTGNGKEVVVKKRPIQNRKKLSVEDGNKIIP